MKHFTAAGLRISLALGIHEGSLAQEWVEIAAEYLAQLRRMNGDEPDA